MHGEAENCGAIHCALNGVRQANECGVGFFNQQTACQSRDRREKKERENHRLVTTLTLFVQKWESEDAVFDVFTGNVCDVERETP